MSPEVYDKIRLYSIYEKLTEAEEDIANGDVYRCIYFNVVSHRQGPKHRLC